MDMMKIGKFIAELRRENKITQEELREKLGVTNKTISLQMMSYIENHAYDNHGH
ncbi:MAG: hypothetical protein K0S41_705 [Anaerocolumna sp.]|jgi:transcriptional regulator with XRE-family HTH domain|nr:hypothetical protein [Anaerocolumna sp.]